MSILQFSDLFEFKSIQQHWIEKRTFAYLNEEEENLFMTQRTFDSFCRSCSSSVTLNSSILLTVVTAYATWLNSLSWSSKTAVWSKFVWSISNSTSRIFCCTVSCQRLSHEISLQKQQEVKEGCEAEKAIYEIVQKGINMLLKYKMVLKRSRSSGLTFPSVGLNR